jgi:nitroreductase
MVIEPILCRRSIRFYREEAIGDELVREVLEAGFCAPSAHGAAPWHAVVVRDQVLREKLASIHKWTRFIARAPVAIVVCVDRTGFDHFWIEDGSAFMENVLIQATALGLGSCWIGIRGVVEDGKEAEKIVREVCGLPEYLGVVGIASLGWPARKPGPHIPCLPDGRVHTNRFGSGKT